jgi:hypothetical protein
MKYSEMSEDVKYIVNDNRAKIKRLREMIKLAEKLNDGPFEIFPLNRVILVKGKNLNDLIEIRKFLRERLGNWNDRLYNIWVQSGSKYVIVDYTGCDHHIKIWIEFKINEFPVEKFQKPGHKCALIKPGPVVETVEPDYKFVCELEVNDD